VCDDNIPVLAAGAFNLVASGAVILFDEASPGIDLVQFLGASVHVTNRVLLGLEAFQKHGESFGIFVADLEDWHSRGNAASLVTSGVSKLTTCPACPAVCDVYSVSEIKFLRSFRTEFSEVRTDF